MPPRGLATMSAVRLRAADRDDADACVEIVRSLPAYFTPSTHDQVRSAVTSSPTWVAEDGDGVVGFLVCTRRFPRSAEIAWAAVVAEHQGKGCGSALVQRVLDQLAQDGVRVVEVKTLDASAGYEPYVATRGFWEHRGFVQVDRIDPLPGWEPGNPAAIYARAIEPAR
jgi:GNAT superfamily N-acetyltransferase